MQSKHVWKSYYAHMSKGDANTLSGTHHLHKIKAIEEIEKEPWACAMSVLLNSAAQRQGKTELPTSVHHGVLTKYMAILTEGLAFHERQDPLARRPGARGRKAKWLRPQPSGPFARLP